MAITDRVMSQEVKYCFGDEDVAHVVENMAELQIRRLPVMNRDKRLVRTVSLGDLALQGSLPKTLERCTESRSQEVATTRAMQPAKLGCRSKEQDQGGAAAGA